MCISADLIFKQVYQKLIDINYEIDQKILDKFKEFKLSSEGKENIALEILLKNAQLASENKIPLCQDTGLVTVIAEIGHEVCLEEPLIDTINRAVASCYTKNYLRKSIVADPLFHRLNTEDNTPAILHTYLVKGRRLKLYIYAKGGGAENASALIMLNPADGVQGVKDFVIARVKEKGSNCCPPLVLGIGIGGNFEMSAVLAKKALFRDIGQRHQEQDYASLELEIYEEINKLNIGMAGFGGKYTALEVFIETAPCHIASLPVALNIGCHSARHAVLELE